MLSKSILIKILIAITFFILILNNLNLKKELKKDKEVLTEMLVNHLENLLLKQMSWRKVDRVALNSNNIEVFDCIIKDILIDDKLNESIQYINETFEEIKYSSNDDFLIEFLGEKIANLNKTKDYAQQIRLISTISNFFCFSNGRSYRDFYFHNFGFVDTRDTLILKANTQYTFPIFLSSALVDFSNLNDEFNNPLFENSIHYLTPKYTPKPFRKKFTVKAKSYLDKWDSFSKSFVIVLEE